MSRQARIRGSESAEISYCHVMSRYVDRDIALRTMAAYIDLNCPRSAQAMRGAPASSGR